ncbi:tRNA(fMet)-specific endonuclease VapC [Ereboglobus sp. PH5-10]|uniref:PIN domain-containing protein n=1 Tax=Ereboglobus sp. PH5-10 TaxID=2940629 RepID=UPI002407398A|nr:PIN domain-containing protein [Ereboglobus sp. PH5-10]MDF9826047.1 tRNA(fMet)-specific endonuclease VapC [Ereboglobus sp. PH5-10]
MILDTNALSAFFEGNPKVVQKFEEMAGVPHLPVIVLGEFRFGLLGSRKKREWETHLAAFARDCVTLSITETTTFHYAEIHHALKKAGTPIPQNDAWIAALAWELNMPVLSDDTHFDLVPRLRRIAF